MNKHEEFEVSTRFDKLVDITPESLEYDVEYGLLIVGSKKYLYRSYETVVEIVRNSVKKCTAISACRAMFQRKGDNNSSNSIKSVL